MTNITQIFKLIILIPVLGAVAACSTNQATGRSQFTGFMPTSQEAAIGAQEHENVMQEFGGAINNPQIESYVTEVGQKIVPYTERKDVNYTFTVLDSPVVNAFALPGGYVYVTRGILTLANNEAELAAVMAHEIGHVTARHSAERYSTSVVTSIGTGLLAAAINVDGASQALGVGADLYLSSYSRSQEHEADDLGVRYLSRAGYNPEAMSDFLSALEASSALEAKESGKSLSSNANSYFSSHPLTTERVTRTANSANQYTDSQQNLNRVKYLKMINGLEVGDSAAQGFISGNTFAHPELGFSFNVPDGYKNTNSSNAFVSQGQNASLVFTTTQKKPTQSIADFLRTDILGGDMSTARDFGTNRINGMNTASVEISGNVNGKQSNVRFIVFEWDKNTVYQFAIAMPVGTPATEIQTLQQSVFSFKRMSAAEKRKYRPKTISLRVAKSGDTAESMSANFPYKDRLNAERFRVINGLTANGQPIPQQPYKVIVQ